MDDVDRRILSRMSRSVELAERPFRNMSEELGIPEGEVISRVRALKDAGVIRRIGAVLDPARLGWVSTLCAADIPEDRIEPFADLTRSMAEITHNYV
ncbi:MAG TPA: Lrp/AsnC family transcriptional regulator, partial [Deltaproteobacteria bacterium]|nr:Lrp/AsnC family transcriptional regulator [Deltaproteobacteria bacterium]